MEETRFHRNEVRFYLTLPVTSLKVCECRRVCGHQTLFDEWGGTLGTAGSPVSLQMLAALCFGVCI